MDEMSTPSNQPICVECEDVPAALLCEQCDDLFCGLCFRWQHKKGKRAKHTIRALPGVSAEALGEAVHVEGTTRHFEAELADARAKMDSEKDGAADKMEVDDTDDKATDSAAASTSTADGGDWHVKSKKKKKRVKTQNVSAATPELAQELSAALNDATESVSERQLRDLQERAQFVPLRLTDEERALLDILEGALNISEYTDNVDVASNMYSGGWLWSGGSGYGVSKKVNRMEHELDEILSLVLGLYISTQFRSGKRMMESQSTDTEAAAAFYARVFEIGRRYKIMNPDKMRTTYGKLIHILQDASSGGFSDFDLIKPIRCVLAFLETRNCADILGDPAIVPAIACIGAFGTTGAEAKQQAMAKRAARQHLFAEYEGRIDKDDLALALDSLADSEAYLEANRKPVDDMLMWLDELFSDAKRVEDPRYSLQIIGGQGGSKLSHSNYQQFHFVRQSLRLWQEVMHNMFELWLCADADLLSPKGYRLVNTGQGLNRVQAAPEVAKTMRSILLRVQRSVGQHWVGLSVVHLGDRDVPNALFFIDKYTQVPRILAPIARCAAVMDDLMANERTRRVVLSMAENATDARRFLLRSYFRHGFNGSGDDGGSCIDGRLTSSWNWCSLVEKRGYYALLLLSGFIGFDGSWKK